MSTPSERFAWEKHSSGIAMKIMNKMGYKGKGLGKTENGITETIKIKPRKIGVNDTRKKKLPEKRMKLYILSDSMLNQMDEKRLSKKLDVKVHCHGGCTVTCMYTHLAPVVKLKPKFILLHIGTNDCVDKTSDEVLYEINQLTGYINEILPTSKVIVSLPTMRTDCKRTNQIIKNFNLKLTRQGYTYLENANINESHLSNKGLHFNGHGIRKMASNIISLIKRL